MASTEQVKRYLAYWFQLGKKVIINHGKTAVIPKKVIEGDRYSPEFEQCWQQIIALDNKDCYLEGTWETIEQLLSPMWEIQPCARCDMPVPTINLGMSSGPCPCFDLPNWPNTEVPAPRSPVDTKKRLDDIRSRLLSRQNQEKPNENSPKSYLVDVSALRRSENHKQAGSEEKSPLPPLVSHSPPRDYQGHNAD